MDVSKSIRKVTICAAVAALILSSPSYAWDGAVSGKIIEVHVTAGENYDFRIYLDSGAMCGNVHAWAYVNKSNPNYEAYVSTITYAFASGRNVTVYSNRDTNGYCKIEYVAVR
jgi:hypothetical protein